MERETGIEPATNSLEGCDSTTELLPLFFNRLSDSEERRGQTPARMSIPQARWSRPPGDSSAGSNSGPWQCTRVWRPTLAEDYIRYRPSHFALLPPFLFSKGPI